jgi:hypothetical protein
VLLLRREGAKAALAWLEEELARERDAARAEIKRLESENARLKASHAPAVKRLVRYSDEELFAMYLPAAVGYLANQDPGLKGEAFEDGVRTYVELLMRMRPKLETKLPERCQAISQSPAGEVVHCGRHYSHTYHHEGLLVSGGTWVWP